MRITRAAKVAAFPLIVLALVTMGDPGMNAPIPVTGRDGEPVIDSLNEGKDEDEATEFGSRPAPLDEATSTAAWHPRKYDLDGYDKLTVTVERRRLPWRSNDDARDRRDRCRIKTTCSSSS